MDKNARRAASSKKLAEMASFKMNELGYGITYVPNGKYVKDVYLWHGMDATKTDGQKWEYWIRYDFDSYAGTFMDE
jgi:hypothetical protein